MKLKKFYEYTNNPKQLTLNDLSMYLREGDTVIIESENGTDTYKVDNITENDVSVVTMGEGSDVQLTFDFADINYKWKLLSINGDDILINEKVKNN